MKISINEPCHEDWNKMTPNEQGAFCLACQKTVVDFSSKTIDEIKTFFVLKPKEESVCGRFRDKQLHELSFDDFITEFMSWKFLKRSAVLCFLVLGTTLFSSCSADEHKSSDTETICKPDSNNNNSTDFGSPHTAGVVAIDTNNKPVVDTGDANPKNTSLLLNDTTKTKKPKKKKVKEPEKPIIHMKGDVAVN